MKRELTPYWAATILPSSDRSNVILVRVNPTMCSRLARTDLGGNGVRQQLRHFRSYTLRRRSSDVTTIKHKYSGISF